MAYSAYRNVKRTKTNTGRRNGAYVEGNTVRKISVAEEVQKPLNTKEIDKNNKKKRKQSLYTNLGNVIFLTGALAVAAMILMSYIRVQSDIIISVRNIAALESELNNLKLSNDEDYARAASSVDMEEVRRVAIGELGMKYAKEGQIINVSGEGSDYVRQLAQIQE